MVTLEEVKEYLNIVGGDDDRILNREIVAGYGYLEDAVDVSRQSMIATKILRQRPTPGCWISGCQTPTTTGKADGPKAGAGMDPRARAMITQLQLYRKE